MNYIKAEWPAPPHIKAYTTTKHLGTGLKNPKLKAFLSLPNEPIWLNQTHSTIALEALAENSGKTADASFTSTPNQVCVVTTGDCLPLLICDKKGTQVAAIHAGWRGLANGIIESTLEWMQQPASELLVWLGPAISQLRYEVGMDVYTAFVEKHGRSAAAFLPHTEGKWLANLYQLAKIRLDLKGVTQIYGGQFCTYSQDDLFFSARRGDTQEMGRIASLIWIDDKKP